LRNEVIATRNELNTRIDSLRSEMNNRMTGVENRINGFDKKIDNRFLWILGVQITTWVTIILAILFR